MIRRISKHNDLKDIIKSCPSGVIDDIYAIEYYIQGHNETIQASFTKTGEVLEVVLPSTDLETLPNGILMRRAFYKVLDSSYPDGYYNLQFEDNMNIWLGDVESEEPVIPDYVTEDELAAALGDLDGNTVEDYVVEVGHRVLDTVAETYATRTWVASQRYAKRDWVEQQNYTSQTYVDNQISTQATRINNIEESYVSTDGLDTILTNYATHFWVQEWALNQGYLNSNSTLPADQIILSVQGLPQNVEGALIQLSGSIDTITTEDIPDLDSRITNLEQSSGSSAWGNITGTITNQTDLMTLLGGYATQANLTTLEESLLTEIDETKRDLQDEIGGVDQAVGDLSDSITLLDGRVTALEQAPSAIWGSITGTITNQTDLMNLLGDYATQQWVQNRGYITNSALTGYATQSWVQNNYASQSWVQQQGYLDSNSTIDGGNVSYYNTGDSLEEVLHDLSQTVYNDYAEKTWVMNQGYLTSSDLSGYATQQWATNQFLEESKVWTGTQAQWNALSAAQKAGYTIALITQ